MSWLRLSSYNVPCYPGTMPRRFPAPWTVTEMPGGFRVTDANGVTVAYVYARDDLVGSTRGNSWLTTEEAWRIARGIAKLPLLLQRR